MQGAFRNATVPPMRSEGLTSPEVARRLVAGGVTRLITTGGAKNLGRGGSKACICQLSKSAPQVDPGRARRSRGLGRSGRGAEIGKFRHGRFLRESRPHPCRPAMSESRAARKTDMRSGQIAVRPGPEPMAAPATSRPGPRMAGLLVSPTGTSLRPAQSRHRLSRFDAAGASDRGRSADQWKCRGSTAPFKGDLPADTAGAVVHLHGTSTPLPVFALSMLPENRFPDDVLPPLTPYAIMQLGPGQAFALLSCGADPADGGCGARACGQTQRGASGQSTARSWRGGNVGSPPATPSRSWRRRPALRSCCVGTAPRMLTVFGAAVAPAGSTVEVGMGMTLFSARSRLALDPRLPLSRGRLRQPRPGAFDAVECHWPYGHAPPPRSRAALAGNSACRCSGSTPPGRCRGGRGTGLRPCPVAKPRRGPPPTRPLE